MESSILNFIFKLVSSFLQILFSNSYFVIPKTDPNSGGQQQNPQQQQMDLLSAVVNEAIGADEDDQLLVEDFAGLVDSMEEIAAGIGEELLVAQGGEHYSLSQPMVGSTIEVETSTTTDHYGLSDHHQIHQQVMEQQQQHLDLQQQLQQQIPNLSLNSDILMINQPSHQQHQQQSQPNIVVSSSEQMSIFDASNSMNIFGSSSNQQQSTMMPPPQGAGNLRPTPQAAPSNTALINPNSVTITPPQSVYRPIQPLPPAIAQKSVPSSLNTAVVSTSAASSKGGQPLQQLQHQQQPQQTQVFFAAAQPSHHQIIRGASNTTMVSVGGQMIQSSSPSATTTNTSVPILFVQQSQQPGSILTSTAVSSSPNFTITSPSPSTSGASVGLGGQIIQIQASRQKLIPVSTTAIEGSSGVVQQRVVQLPANVRLAPLAQTVQLGRGPGQQIITTGSSLVSSNL